MPARWQATSPLDERPSSMNGGAVSAAIDTLRLLSVVCDCRSEPRGAALCRNCPRRPSGRGRAGGSIASTRWAEAAKMVGMILPMLISVVLATHIGQAGTLTFTKPAAWTERAPASSMRVAEFVVPRAPGDAEDGELIVYYFGGAAAASRRTFNAGHRSSVGEGSDPDILGRQRSEAHQPRCQRHVRRRGDVPVRRNATTSLRSGCARPSWRRRRGPTSSS